MADGSILNETAGLQLDVFGYCITASSGYGGARNQFHAERTVTMCESPELVDGWWDRTAAELAEWEPPIAPRFGLAGAR